MNAERAGDEKSEPWVYEVMGRLIQDAIKSYADKHKIIKGAEKYLATHSSSKSPSGSKKYKLLMMVHEYTDAKNFLFSDRGGLRTYIEEYGLPLNLSYVRMQAKYAGTYGYEEMLHKMSTTGLDQYDRDMMARRAISFTTAERESI